MIQESMVLVQVRGVGGESRDSKWRLSAAFLQGVDMDRLFHSPVGS